MERHFNRYHSVAVNALSESIQSISQSSYKLNSLQIGDARFIASRSHPFGIVIQGLDRSSWSSPDPAGANEDYLHRVLLAPSNRDDFLRLVTKEKLVVCKNVTSTDPTYRRVRGKSSGSKLSQAEYYHHDGCSCPTKPQVVEIRLPHQSVPRGIATAIAPFADVVPAMLKALPPRLRSDEIGQLAIEFSRPTADRQPSETWDRIQGRITRLVRREMDAESCRAYFREVDKLANAYVLPWEMGESRLMLNNHDDLAETMQHRRSLQKPKGDNDSNGSLVKRWTAEEYPAVP